MAAIGTVSFITGRVLAEDAAGNQRILALGDEILEGERIITAAGSKIEINMLSGDNIVVADGQSWSPTSETFTSPEDFATDDATLSPADLALQQALLSGADPTEVGEATAAGAPAAGPGGAPGGGDGGTSFVTIQRTAGEVNPSAGYETIATNANIVGPAVDPQRFIDVPTLEINPGVAGNNINVIEGQNAVFTVSVTDAAVGSTLTLALADGTALDADYFDSANAGFFEYSTDGGITFTTVAGAIALAEGDTDLLVRTDTIDDILDEVNELFSLLATLSSGGVDFSATGTATIIDNDDPTVVINPGVESDSIIVIEGQDAVFTISVKDTAVGSTLTLTLADGTAVDADYFDSANAGFFEYSTDA
ncbi:MAG: retention module-containing protein, partial [Pseudomonadales bacterium]|nr:retention module-containing protein [Pseudomonadales bacterium]